MPSTTLFPDLDPEDRAAALAALRHDIARRRRRAAAVSPRTKLCPVCQEAKPVDEFNTDTSRGDGLEWRCRACLSAARRREGTPVTQVSSARNPAQTYKA